MLIYHTFYRATLC